MLNPDKQGEQLHVRSVKDDGELAEIHAVDLDGHLHILRLLKDRTIKLVEEA